MAVIEPATVLQAERAAPAAGRVAPRGRVLVAGAVGRLGEALLNEVLARGGYTEVVALVEDDATMSLGVRGLSLAPLHALPPIDDVCIVHGDPAAPGARAVNGRDAPFALVDAAAMTGVAEAAAAAGARGVVLVHPLPAWQQMSRFHLGLIGEAELRLAQMRFASVTVLRPLSQSGSAAGGWLQRIANVYLSLQFLMMPRSLPTLTSPQIARVAVDVLRAPEPGVRVIGAAQIGERLRAAAPKR
jgi:hypothetical protein